MIAEPDLDTISESLRTNPDGWDFAQAGIVLVAAIIIARIVRLVVRRLVARSPADDFLGDLFGRLAGYVIVTVGLVYALEGLGVAVAPLLGALGIAGIALAFALQDILENFVAGIILQVRRPFTAGDEIESNGHEGTVLSLDVRTVTIRTPDGETIRLPSAAVMKEPIINHTQFGRRRTTIDVGVAYGSDLGAAAAAATDAVSRVDGVLDHPAPEGLVHTFGPSSVDLAVRFWHTPSIAAHWEVRDAAVRAVSAAFAEAGISIPFPQRVVHGAPLDEEHSGDAE